MLAAMKTAVSIPNSLFEAADGLAQKLGVSRSELYARALTDFLMAHERSDVTQALDRVYGEEESTLDPVLADAQRTALSLCGTVTIHGDLLEPSLPADSPCPADTGQPRRGRP
jgi:metal-responsive CopG/Arc/MetJ family transcriptional regulator